MVENESNINIPKPLRAYIVLVAIAGMGLLIYLAQRAEWGLSTLGELGLFAVLIAVAGCFPIPAAPRVKADVTTAVLFAIALVLEPGVAALAAVLGMLAYNLLIRFWGDRLRLPR